jgi:nucleotide-binding universal stress UspA family protein
LIGLPVEEGLPRYAATMGEVDEFEREKDTYFERVRAEAARIAEAHDVRLTHEVRVGHAADTIVRFVDEAGADLAVLGYRGHSRIARLVIGTTAQKVNACSKASVLSVKDAPPPRIIPLADRPGSSPCPQAVGTAARSAPGRRRRRWPAAARR